MKITIKIRIKIKMKMKKAGRWLRPVVRLAQGSQMDQKVRLDSETCMTSGQ